MEIRRCFRRIFAENVVHVIDAVLLPRAEACDSNSIVGIAESAGNFSTLLAALDAAVSGDLLRPGRYSIRSD